MFEALWGAEGCTCTIFFSDFPGHPLTRDSVTPHLHTGQRLCFKLQHCIPPKLGWNAPCTQDSVLMPAADTEAMPNQLPEQSAGRPQRCFSAPAAMRGQKEREQSPLTTWGGCQGIKYCSEFRMSRGMTHSSCRSTGKGGGAGCTHREWGTGCRGKVSKGCSRERAEIQPKLWGTTLLRRNTAVLSHTLSPEAFEGCNLHSCSCPWAQQQRRGWSGIYFSVSWFSLCLLPVEIPRAWKGSTCSVSQSRIHLHKAITQFLVTSWKLMLISEKGSGKPLIRTFQGVTVSRTAFLTHFITVKYLVLTPSLPPRPLHLFIVHFTKTPFFR